jgi:hypothetical protein
MKNALFILMTLIFVENGFAQYKGHTSEVSLSSYSGQSADNSLLSFYQQYGTFTDPGEFDYLYKDLPESLPELCRLVRAQFIHPFAQLPECRDRIPEERWMESIEYPTVQSILEGLVSHDSAGLIYNRKVEDRLVLGCRHNAILLASILKYRGIPARVRCGHVPYLIPGFNASHTICEVWNEMDNRWMLVDPSTDRIDFSQEEFDFSHELWLSMQKGEIDTDLYGLPGRYSGFVSIVGKVSFDLASLMGIEYPIFQYAPILDYAFENNDQLAAEHIETLNRVSELMKSIDAENLSLLVEIYNNTPQIQITESFISDLTED